MSAVIITPSLPVCNCYSVHQSLLASNKQHVKQSQMPACSFIRHWGVALAPRPDVTDAPSCTAPWSHCMPVSAPHLLTTLTELKHNLMTPKRNDLPSVMMDDHLSKPCLSYWYKENFLGREVRLQNMLFWNNIHSLFQLKHNSNVMLKLIKKNKVNRKNIMSYFSIGNKIIHISCFVFLTQVTIQTPNNTW